MESCFRFVSYIVTTTNFLPCLEPTFKHTGSTLITAGFPSVVVFNHKKKTIVPYVGAFAESNMNEFLRYNSNQTSDLLVNILTRFSGLLRGATKRATPI